MQTRYAILVGLLAMFSSFASWAQDATEKIVVSQPNAPSREEYYVVKGNPQLRQGPYARYGGKKGKTLVEQGFYKAGQKDSVWTTYLYGSKRASATGHYRHNQRVGVWEYFSKEGTLLHKFDHTTGKVLFAAPSEYLSKIEFQAIAANEQLTSTPYYIEGPEALQRTAAMAVRYPAVALRNHVQGIVWIAFTVDSAGRTSNHRVVQSVGSGCDEEALRVVRQLPGEWIPAYANGQPVAAECRVPMMFALK